MDKLLTPTEQWLRSIDIWDPKYDYVMHKSHWLTTEWSPHCDQCLSMCQKKRESTTLTSSPVKVSTSMNSTAEPTLKNESNYIYTKAPSTTTTTTTTTEVISDPTTSTIVTPPKLTTLTTGTTTSKVTNATIEVKYQPIEPPQPNIPVTPIAPTNLASRAFVTPHTTNKFHDTFTRSTRATTKKLLNQTSNNPDLINLNETFDLYKSALAETPDSDLVSESLTADPNVTSDRRKLVDLDATTDKTNMITSPLTTVTTSSNAIQKPSKPQSNFELLTNYQTSNGNYNFNPSSLQQESDQQPVTSRIPRIPSSKERAAEPRRTFAVYSK